MTTPVPRRGSQATSAVVLVVGGAAVAGATWAAGNLAWAIAVMAAYVVLAAGAYLWAGRAGDIAALLRGSGDERQRGLDRDATAFTALVLIVAALAGALVSIGRSGNPGVYGAFCVIAGTSYVVALLALQRRG